MYTRADTDVPVGIVANAVRAVAVPSFVTTAGATVEPFDSALGNAYTALDGIVNTHATPTTGVNVTLCCDLTDAAMSAVTVCLSTSTTFVTDVRPTSVDTTKSLVLTNPSPRVDANVNVTLAVLPTTSV